MSQSEHCFGFAIYTYAYILNIRILLFPVIFNIFIFKCFLLKEK